MNGFYFSVCLVAAMLLGACGVHANVKFCVRILRGEDER